MILYARIARWESLTCRWYVSIRDKIREARFNILLIVWLRTSEQIQPQFLVQPRERMSSRQQRVFQTRKLPLLLVAAGLGSWNSLRVLRVWSSAHPKTIVTTVFCQCCNSIAILCGPATWLQSVYMHIMIVPTSYRKACQRPLALDVLSDLSMTTPRHTKTIICHFG